MDPKIVIAGDLKFRGTRKWRPRWGIVTRLSPVADCLHLQLYRDQKERIKSGLTKASLSLEKFIGLEAGFTLDKESNTLALICQDMVLLLAFNTRETLLCWQTAIRTHLPQEHQYPVEIVQFPAKSRLAMGPSRLHIRDGCFALVSGNPPRLCGLWQLPDLRRYGVLNGKFCFEGGSSCGKGEGLHVLQTLQTGELMKDFQLASIGNLQPKRKLSTIKRDKCNNNLSDRISFCSSSSHSSETGSISSGNGSYQSSLEFSTPRPSISGHNHSHSHHHHHHHHGHHHHHQYHGGSSNGAGECSNCSGSSVELWYDKLKMLRSANPGLILFNSGCGGGDGSSSICSCLSESNLTTTTTLDATTKNSHLNRNHNYSCDTFDCESTSSSTNTLKRTTYNSSHGSDSGSNGITVDPRVLHKLITGHYQIPKSLLNNHQGKNLMDSEEDKVNLINNLEMYDVPRKFQQIHLDNNLADLKQSIDCSKQSVDSVNNKINDLNNNNNVNDVKRSNGFNLNPVNCCKVDDKGLNINYPVVDDDEMLTIITDSRCKSIACNCNAIESTTTIKSSANNNVNSEPQSGKLQVNCDQQIESTRQFKSRETNEITNANGLTSTTTATTINSNESTINSTNHEKRQINCCSINSTFNSNYANIDFVRSLQFYQNVGLLKKQLKTTNNSTGAIKPAANLPAVSKQSTKTSTDDVNQLNCDNFNQKQKQSNEIEVNYNLMVNKSTDGNNKDDDYLEMIPLLISDDCRSESDLSDHNQSEFIYQHYLNHFHHYHHHHHHHHHNQLNHQQQNQNQHALINNQTDNCSNIFLIMTKDQNNNDQINNNSASSPSSSTNNQQTKSTLINPLSRSLSDLRRKLWSRVKSIDCPSNHHQQSIVNQFNYSSSSCPSSPSKLLSTNHLNHQPISSTVHDEQLILSLPIPPPPPPPPLSYLFACRLNKSMESLLTLNNDQQLTNNHINCPTGTLNNHHNDLTSSDEDIYHASQIRVISSSPFNCRPMSPSEIKRSTSLPNGQSTINNMINDDQQQLNTTTTTTTTTTSSSSTETTATTTTTINNQLESNEKCNNQGDYLINTKSTLNDLNKSTANCNNQNGKTSMAILIKSRSTNDYVEGNS